MARTLPSELKICEKLFILNDRGEGLLTRLYNIKKACGDSKSKPAFLSEKSLENAIKHIIRRFPNIDSRGGNSSQLNAVFSIRSEIMKSLSLYYYTFVDLLEFKDHVGELLTTMDATIGSTLDITNAFDLTKNYLDLVVTYTSLMVLLSRVDDRRAVLGLFNTAHEMTHGNNDTSFGRLGQMIVDFEFPMKKLSEEFIPHAKLLFQALMSLQYIYPRRTVSVEELRKSQMLSVIANPAQMLNPAQTETMACEFLSLDVLERWITFGFLLIHPYLSQPPASQLFHDVLQANLVQTLFRDEVIQIHAFCQSFFDTIKGYNKKVAEIKECFNYAMTNACLVHRERRKYLRTALRELSLILADQPGLLAPKLLFVLIGLSMSRYEVHWLLRHSENMPTRHSGRSRNMADDLLDRQLPELLFYIEELRILVKKYSQVIRIYYVKYLTDYDAVALDHMLQNVTVIPEEDSVILSSIVSTIASLSNKQVGEELLDFRPLRLDWMRLQAYASVAKYPLSLNQNRELTSLLNTLVFHTRAVDSLDELLFETSDLSIFCFYSYLFESMFHQCLEFPAQTRFIIAFPMICSHFISCTCELCPEERIHIGDRSLTQVSGFLEEMAKEAKDIITTLVEETCQISDKLLPKHCAALIGKVTRRSGARRDKRKEKTSDPDLPGSESYRKTREELTTMDKLNMALSELAYSINYVPLITVWEHSFAPREYLSQALENRFNKSLVKMLMYNAETNEIAKPTELLNSVKNFMNVLETIENYVHIDITRVFNNSMLQQSQALDSHGERTLCSLYTNWYLESLLRRVTTGNIAYSRNQRAFITLSAEGDFCAEEFSDINELHALSELLGPYGLSFLNTNLTFHIASQINELRKLVLLNKDILMAFRSNYDKPEQMKELLKRLQNVDNLLQRISIIGVLISFRALAQECLNDVLNDRIPFLLSSIKDFKNHVPNGDSMMVSEMASASGLQCRVDPALVAALRSTKNDLAEDEYTIACLLMVFVAVSIPKLAKNEGSCYRPCLEGHTNNIHCIAESVNVVASTLFTICGHGDIEDRLKEFLALASSSLLRLGSETDKDAIKNRESVYLLLDLIVQESPFLTMDLLESCFPYALLRNAYHAVYRA